MLEHVQMRFYLDKKYSLDFYGDFINKDTMESLQQTYYNIINKINMFYPDNHGMKSYQFKITYCEKCGQMILTNRRYKFKIDCKKCGNRSIVHPCKNYVEEKIVSEFEKKVGICKNALGGKIGYLLLISYDTKKEEIIRKILDEGNYNEENKENFLYKFLIYKLFIHNMLLLNNDPDTTIFFYSHVFNDTEYEYNHQVESIDSILDEIKKVSRDVISASIAIDPRENIYQLVLANESEFIEILEKTIQEDPFNIQVRSFLSRIYIMNKRFKDAYETLIIALNMEPDNTEIKENMKLLLLSLSKENDVEINKDNNININDNDGDFQSNLVKEKAENYHFTNAIKKKQQYSDALKELC